MLDSSAQGLPAGGAEARAVSPAAEVRPVGAFPSLMPAADESLPLRRRRPWRWALVAVGVAAAAAVARSTVLAAKPVAVEVVPAARGPVEQTVSNTRAGTVKARFRARLYPEAGGRVVELPYREGARVAQGSVLLRVDAALQAAQLELAAEDIRAAAARADEACRAAEAAESELLRYTSLRQDGIASDQMVDGLSSDRDRSYAGCRAARATLGQARARERLGRVELAHTELRAPFGGVVAEVNTEVGEWLAPALPSVAVSPAIELLDPASLYVVAPIDEMDAERVRVGQEVRIGLDSRRGEHFRGRLVRVAPYVADLVEQNRTVEVEAEFEDPASAIDLLPGTSADLEVVLSRRDDALRIPAEAVGPGGTVLVLADGRLQERAVKTGLQNWKAVEVTEGLEPGELVVTSRDSVAVRAGAAAVPKGEQ